MPADFLTALGLVLTALVVALANLAALSLWQMQSRARTVSPFLSNPLQIVFLFDGARLVDATPSARSLLAEDEASRAWARLLSRLQPMFPDLGTALAGLPRQGEVTISSGPGIEPPVLLRGEYLTGLTRLTVIDNAAEHQAGGRPGDSATLAALQHELGAQRAILSQAPVLMWRENPAGEVIWANHAYLIRASELLAPGVDLSWPLPGLLTRPRSAQRLAQAGRSASGCRCRAGRNGSIWCASRRVTTCCAMHSPPIRRFRLKPRCVISCRR